MTALPTVQPVCTSVEMVTIPDDDADGSYLDQDGFEDRRDAYYNGEFMFVGIRARAEILLPGGITQTIESPGLWSIEDDSGDDYLGQVYRDELATLKDMLHALNVDTSMLHEFA